MQSAPIVHSIDVVLDRADQALLIDALTGEPSLRDADNLALLHSIFFHRVFGNITPITKDVLDVTFVHLILPSTLTCIAVGRRSRAADVDRVKGERIRQFP
jgi:Autophagy-related protein 101